MTSAESTLKHCLELSMQKYIDEMCETDEWAETGIIVHSEIAYDLANASFAVLKAMIRGQQYAIREGYLKS